MTKPLDINYIERLTEDLIGKYNLHRIPKEIDSRMGYLFHTYGRVLASKTFQGIGSDTLGKIVGNIGCNEVRKALNACPLLSIVGSDGASILKTIAAALLSIIIFDRLNPECKDSSYKPSRFVLEGL